MLVARLVFLLTSECWYMNISGEFDPKLAKLPDPL